ncbi:MAG: LysM peptidoglycan-binding domain-containing protein [Psychrobium sp.]
MWRVIILCLFVVTTSWANADELKVKADSPKRYVVVKGDTLWDISSKFLSTPWRWPELWGMNKQIADPHWIFPGDVLNLVMVDGKPRLVVERGKPKLKMTRHGRKSRKVNPIPTIPLEDIQQHLTEHQVVTLGEYDDLPVLVGAERNSVFYKNTDIVFVNQKLVKDAKYGLYSRGRVFSSPKTNQTLGLELNLIATGVAVESADISQLQLTSVKSQVSNGAVIMPLPEDDLPAYFMPEAAPADLASEVIGSAKLYRESGLHNVVIIDGGSEQGIKQGNVFSAYQPGKIQFVDSEGVVRDPATYRSYDRIKAYFVDDESQKLPNVYRGKVMVFRSFSNLSYALIIDIKRPVRLGDELINP